MFQSILIVSGQVGVLFLLILVGFLCEKTGLIDNAGTKQFTNFLFQIVTPAIIIQSFNLPFDSSLLRGLLLTAGISVAFHGFAIGLSCLLYRKQPAAKKTVLRYATIYANTGYMALPVIGSVVGKEGIFYGSIYMLVFTLFVWTHGVVMFSQGSQKISLKKVLLNPGTIGMLIGLPIFLFSLRLPSVVSDAVSFLAGCNTPLAMVIIGAFVARSDLRSAFTDLGLYEVSLMRLLVLPGLLVLALKLSGVPALLTTTILISAACPTAANTAMFAEMYGYDTALSSKAVSVTTLLSILTIPVLIVLSRM